MTHGSLFSGIGGFDLAAEWMGWDNLFHCEWNPFGQKVLKHYWPNATSYEDITKSDFTIWNGRIDVLTGGFPCQPYSTAGKRLGKEDERHLWPEMLRAIREISPRWVVGENVRGLISWNGGLVFDEVQADLEAAGYEILPFLLPACAVNAPHERYRIWFVAHAKGARMHRKKGNVCEADGGQVGGLLSEPDKPNNGHGATWPITNTSDAGIESVRCERENKIHGPINATDACCTERTQRAPDAFGQNRTEDGARVDSRTTRPSNAGDAANSERRGGLQIHHESQPEQPNGQSPYPFDDPSYWDNWPTVAPLCNGDDGLSSRLGLTALSFSKWRAESVKAGGNAVVPEVVYQIFRAIEQYENLHT